VSEPMIKLSCVTAVLNACGEDSRAKLASCIRSVAALACSHEHRFYDGGSRDGTQEAVVRLAEGDPALVLVSEPDKGVYAALNKGVRDARGEWFYVLGSDDCIVDPKALDEILADATDDVDVIVAPVLGVDADGRERRLKVPNPHLLFQSTPYCHQGVLVRTSVMRELGGFDERYRVAADYDLFFALHLAHKRIRFVDKVFASYAQGGLSDHFPQVMYDDFAALLTLRLQLGEWSAAFYRRRGFPPFPCVAKYLFHADASVRRSARHVLCCWSSYCWDCFYDQTVTRAIRWYRRIFRQVGKGKSNA